MGDGSPWPDTALVLAAGLGTRMRPLTLTMPKALVKLGTERLIDRAIDRLARAGVERVVVNVHHYARQLVDYLAARAFPNIQISSEAESLLETGGAVKQAAPILGAGPIWIVSVDSVWTEEADAFETLAALWRANLMDCLLLLAPVANCSGIDGRGDFDRNADGRLRFRTQPRADFAYTGLSLLTPAAAQADDRPAFPLRDVWSRLEVEGRLFGAELQGRFLHVGDPASLALAERALARGRACRRPSPRRVGSGHDVR